MKKRVLPIALLLALGLVACGPTAPSSEEKPSEPDVPATSEPAPSEDQTTTEAKPSVSKIEITNKAELQAEWHEKDDADVSRSLAIKTDVPINMAAALKNGELVITSSDDKVIQASGKVLIAVAKGTATITVTYKETISDSVEITILEEKVVPVIGIKALREGIADGTYKKDSIVDFYGKIVATAEPTAGDNGEIHNGIWIADGDYAMMLYAGNTQEQWAAEGMKMGDMIYAKGKLSPYNGLNEVKPTEFRKMTAEDKYTIAEPTVLEVTADNFSAEGLKGNDGRRFNAKGLIYVDGAIEAPTSRATLNFKWVKADKTEVKVPLSVNYHIGVEAMTALKAKTDTLAPGNKVDLTGVISWFNAPQLELQFIEGKTPAECMTIETQPDPTKLTISGANTVKATEFIDLKVAAEPAGSSPAVTWSVDNEAIATIDQNGRLTGVKEGEVTVTATSKKVTTLTATYKVTVTKAPITNGPVAVETIEDGATYKLGVKLAKTGETGFVGSTIADYKLAPVASYEEAASVTVKAVEGGYNLILDGKVFGISRSPKQDKPGQFYNNIAFDKAESETVKNVWVWDEARHTFHVVFADTDFDDLYLGNRDTNTTFELGITPRKYVLTGNNVFNLYDYIVNPTEAKVEAGEYLFAMDHPKLNKVLYLNGKMAGFYLGTTTDYTAAVKVTVAADGTGYTLKVGEQFIAIQKSADGQHTNIVYRAEKCVFTYNEEIGAFTIALEDGKTYAIGTKATGTYDTMSAVETPKNPVAAARLYNVPTAPAAIGVKIVAAKGTEVKTEQTLQLEAVAYPSGASQVCTWETSDATKATVKDGVVTGVAEGTVTITAKANETVKASIEITVVKGATKVGTITFDSDAKRTAYSTTQQIWTENGITVTNDKSASTSDVNNAVNPVKFYAHSSLKIEAGKEFTTIILHCTSGKAMKPTQTIEGATVTLDEATNTSTITLTAAAKVLVIADLAAQIRVLSIDLF